MGNDDVVWSSLKILLFPRLTTVYDLERVVERCRTSPKDIVRGGFSNADSFMVRLAERVVSRFRPLVRRKNRTAAVTKDDVGAWIDDLYEIIKMLLDHGKERYARALTLQWLGTYYYLLTLYALWNNISPSTRPIFGKGRFEEDALELLVSLVDDERFRMLIERLGLGDEFNFSLAAYACSLASALNLAPEKQREALEEKLGKILAYKVSLGELIDMLEHVGAENISTVRHIVGEVLFSLGNIIREAALRRDARIAESLIRVAEKIMVTTAQHRVVFSDIVWVVSGSIAGVLLDLLKKDIRSAVTKLGDLGKHILSEKVEWGRFSERIMLRIMPEAQALLPALVMVPINLVDSMTTISINHILNDMVNEVLGCFLEAKIMLSAVLMLEKETLMSFVESAMMDPLASAAMISLLGSPAAWLLETSITLTGTENQSEIINKCVDVVYRYVLSIKNRTQKLIDGPLSFGLGKRIAAAHLLREATFLSLRLTEEAISIIQGTDSGRSLLSLMENLTHLMEEIYGIARPRPAEKIEDLIT